MNALRDLQTVAARHRWTSAVAGCWLVAILAMGTRGYLQPERNSVFPIYANAGRVWLDEGNVYFFDPGVSVFDRFLYSPPVAGAFGLLALVPQPLGEALWRLLNAGVFLWGFARLMRAFGADGWGDRKIAAAGLLLLPLGLPSLNNAQANPLVIGGVMLAVADALRQRWSWTAAWLTLAIVLKAYPVAAALLMVLLAPRKLAWRLPLALAAALLLPFVLWDGDYVARMYVHWFRTLAADDYTEKALSMTYRDFHLLLRCAGVWLAKRDYLLVQLAVAAGIAGLTLASRWRGDAAPAWRQAFDLGCCWMTLFGPATENPTYILLAPSLVLACVDGEDWPRWLRAAPRLAVALMFAGMLVTAFPGGRHVVYFVNPLAALIFFTARLAAILLAVKPAATNAQPDAGQVVYARVRAGARGEAGHAAEEPAVSPVGQALAPDGEPSR